MRWRVWVEQCRRSRERFNSPLMFSRVQNTGQLLSQKLLISEKASSYYHYNWIPTNATAQSSLMLTSLKFG